MTLTFNAGFPIDLLVGKLAGKLVNYDHMTVGHFATIVGLIQMPSSQSCNFGGAGMVRTLRTWS